MRFKNNTNMWGDIFLLALTSFFLGMILESNIKTPELTIILIEFCVLALVIVINQLRIRFDPSKRTKRIEKRISKQTHLHQKLKLFFEDYVPETRKSFPKKIYKYISLDKIDELEKEKLSYCYNPEEIEKLILTSKENKGNINKLYSLANNSLWFSKSNNPNLNDPFEGRGIFYDDSFYKFSDDQIQYWQQYAEYVRNNIYLCCFAKYSASPTMWANYSNNYRGYCLEFEIVNTNNLWEVYYGYGKNYPNSTIKDLENELWADQISKSEAYEYIEQLHVFWATFKFGDWQYENEIRAIFTKLEYEKNICYEDIGLKLIGIIVGHNCDEKHREFLAYIANKLSIPLKITKINITSKNYLDIVEYNK